jgi:ribosomal protein S27E
MADGVNNEPKVVDTSGGTADGQTKCPKCGATDISLSVKTGKLRCNFCRHQFDPIHIQGMETDLTNLQGEVYGSGTNDINAAADQMVTLKCQSCGAEVVIDTSEVTQARCHWCRNTLSINNKLPNGAVPDVVLPFSVTKAEAQQHISDFVGRRRFFAHPKFRQEFTTDNIMGVYFPYMVVDFNSHVHLAGMGEHEVRSYTVRRGKNSSETYYDADLYQVERDFDLTIDGLTVESSADKLNTGDSSKTTNIINSIMPFDVENSVKWDANYLKGFSSERRDTNIEELRPIVESQAKDVAKFSANPTLKNYDRGVRWENEDMQVKGQQWKAAYLPVWLYSYMEKKNGDKKLHYVAVNARTKETMGSVPIHFPKLIAISAIIELLCIVLMMSPLCDELEEARLLLLIPGILYYFIIYSRYRNSGARHSYETETPCTVLNMKESDVLVRRETRLSNAYIRGRNNTRLTAQQVKANIGRTVGRQ